MPEVDRKTVDEADIAAQIDYRVSTDAFRTSRKDCGHGESSEKSTKFDRRLLGGQPTEYLVDAVGLSGWLALRLAVSPQHIAEFRQRCQSRRRSGLDRTYGHRWLST